MEDTRKIAIEGRDLVKQYGKNFALNHVNVRVYEGEFLSLLGPSGCGKTTLLKILSGLDVPTSGAVLLDDADVTQVPAHGRPSNMVFQQLALFPHMDVWHNVAYGLKVKKEKKEVIRQKVDEVLRLVRLEDYGSHMPRELSGGQAQRVAIARALVNSPRVLFLDEPLSALDQKLRVRMQQELKRIQKKSGSTFVFVTHDQQEAIAISDRIAVMNNGVLQQIDTVQNIYENPANEFVAKFIGETNIFMVDFQEVKDGYAWVKYLDKYLFKCRYSEKLDLSQKAGYRLSVRNQYIRVSAASCGGENEMHGVVTESEYGGTNHHYAVRTDDGPVVYCVCPVHRVTKHFSEGEEVFVSWDAEDSLLLGNEADDRR